MASTINGTSTDLGGLVTSGDDSGILQLQTNETTAVTIDASQNVGVGTASPSYKLDVNGSIRGDTFVRATSGSVSSYLVANSGGSFGVVGTASNHPLLFNTNDTERARIDSSGNLLVGTTSAYNNTNTFFKTSGANLPALCAFKNSAANTDNAFVVTNGAGGGTNSFIILANGNALNTNNSYGAISDARLKENIEDATPKLADLMQVRIRQYNLIADEEKQKQLGVVADELETVFPAMVAEDNNGFKNVKYSVFVPMLIKAIQEQQAQISSQAAVITTLTERITALEGATQ